MKQNTKFHITFLCPQKNTSHNLYPSHIHGCKEVMNMKEDTILKVLPWDVRSIIQKEKLEFEYLQEIRSSGRKATDLSCIMTRKLSRSESQTAIPGDKR